MLNQSLLKALLCFFVFKAVLLGVALWGLTLVTGSPLVFLRHNNWEVMVLCAWFVITAVDIIPITGILYIASCSSSDGGGRGGDDGNRPPREPDPTSPRRLSRQRPTRLMLRGSRVRLRKAPARTSCAEIRARRLLFKGYDTLNILH